MRPLLALAALLLAVAPAASASDAQLRSVIRHRGDDLNRILGAVHRDSGAPALAHTGVRIARLARRSGRLVSHLAPSTPAGATARHQAVAAFRELRVGGRLLVLAVGARAARQDTFLGLAFGRMFSAILALANAETLLRS